MPAVGWTLSASPDQVLSALGIGKAIDKGLFGAATELVNAWQDHLNTPGRGKVYDVELRTLTVGGRTFVAPVGPRVPHRASADGDSPAPDSGAAKASPAMEDLPKNGRVRVGTDKRYLRYLKDGVTDHPGGIQIAPRDVTPDIEQVRPKMTEEMRRALAPVAVRVA